MFGKFLESKLSSLDLSKSIKYLFKRKESHFHLIKQIKRKILTSKNKLKKKEKNCLRKLKRNNIYIATWDFLFHLVPFASFIVTK